MFIKRKVQCQTVTSTKKWRHCEVTMFTYFTCRKRKSKYQIHCVCHLVIAKKKDGKDTHHHTAWQKKNFKIRKYKENIPGKKKLRSIFKVKYQDVSTIKTSRKWLSKLSN